MKLIQVFVIAIIITGIQARCHAGANCDDWREKRGYCVDYIKTKIPTFPVPQSAAELAALKNRDVPDIAEGDVAIFRYRNYWHVAYVEKVHRDKDGKATALDVSEMNFGRQLSLYEFEDLWNVKSDSEWKRAVSCGVTCNFTKKTSRKNVALSTVKQVWSPASTAANAEWKRRVKIVIDKVKGILGRFFLNRQSKENS